MRETCRRAARLMPVRECRQKKERGEATDHCNAARDHGAKDTVGISDRGHRSKRQGYEAKRGCSDGEVLPELESIVELIAGRGDEDSHG